MATRYLRLRNTHLFAALALALTTSASAETVVYHGSLQDGGKPANGQFDVQLRLYSASVGGVPVSEAITLSSVKVENGRFSVPLDLAQPLPKQGSVWLEAQLQASGGGGFQPLEGRQEINAKLGGTCWETTGNALMGASGTLGISDSNSTVLTLQNDTTWLSLRRNGGVEQGNSTATGVRSAAFGNGANAAAVNSFAAGKGNVLAAHSYSTVFADNSVGTSFDSTAANQFLVRAQNGVGINTNAPLGSLSVRRGGASGVATAYQSVFTGESDNNTYISLLTPSNRERGVLFGDPVSSSSGGIIYNPGLNPNGLTFRTGGNIDRLLLTKDGHMRLNDPPFDQADVAFKARPGPIQDFGMSFYSANNNSATLSVSNDSSKRFSVYSSGVLSLSAATYIETNTLLGIARTPVSSALEVNGNASKNTAGSWLANSDRRIKTDIAPISDALSLINRIEPVTFRYNNAYLTQHDKIINQRYYNVIAQDFAKVFPDAVKGSGEYLPGTAKTKANEILQVDTYPATITAIAAIQELDAANALQDREVAELKAVVTAQKQENAELRQRLDALEQLLHAKR